MILEDVIPHIIMVTAAILGFVFGFIVYRANRPPNLTPIYTITMDESCFNQLKSSNMVQLKILK
jgi:hypothetical protein